MYAKELVRDIQSFPASNFYYGTFVSWFSCGKHEYCPKSVYMGGQLYIFSRDAVKWIGTFNKPLNKIGHEDIVTGMFLLVLFVAQEDATGHKLNTNLM